MIVLMILFEASYRDHEQDLLGREGNAEQDGEQHQLAEAVKRLLVCAQFLGSELRIVKGVGHGGMPFKGQSAVKNAIVGRRLRRPPRDAIP